jgi:hypothetical protein
MPELATFPKSQQVTFKYYEGVLAFLEENYAEVCRRDSPLVWDILSLTMAKAEKHLTEAWNMCHKDARRNKE